MSPSTGVVHRMPESNSAPGPAHSVAGIVKNSLSTGAFHYESLNSNGTSVAGKSSKSRTDDHQVHCSCGPFLGSRGKQLGGRTRSSKVSGLRGGIDETPAASLLLRLLASYGKLRDSIKETNVNVYDLLVGNQMLFLMTASPIIPRAKNGSLPVSSSRRLSLVPVTSFSSSSSTLGQTSNDVGVQCSKSLSRTRGRCESSADRLLPSFRR